MVQVSRFQDFSKINSLFIRESDKIIKNNNIEYISLKGVKFPLISLYEIVSVLFENNSINLKISDIILLTLLSIGMISNENKDTVKILYNKCNEKNILNHLPLVKNTIKSIKNLLNIIFGKYEVITNIEQGLKNKQSIKVLSITREFLKMENIGIQDFSMWYISDKRDKISKNLIDYILINC